MSVQASSSEQILEASASSDTTFAAGILSQLFTPQEHTVPHLVSVASPPHSKHTNAAATVKQPLAAFSVYFPHPNSQTQSYCSLLSMLPLCSLCTPNRAYSAYTHTYINPARGMCTAPHQQAISWTNKSVFLRNFRYSWAVFPGRNSLLMYSRQRRY